MSGMVLHPCVGASRSLTFSPTIYQRQRRSLAIEDFLRPYPLTLYFSCAVIFFSAILHLHWIAS
jgi:hypothetical protein